ncbi:MAG TPA: LutB/LldF family L-lactate oxidation iron-sulfur protein, partial [Verrucomicrobiae bacterium]|nr:LutB/LldF family L-lactate oxidation iron-sulfur protein [Verrucomicrobiae bacterium]
RLDAAETLGHWQEWRERGRAIRRHVVSNLDYYLNQLTKNVRHNGGNVHFAHTGADAVNIIMEIAARRQAKAVVKSKSMISEEIHLNEALVKKGIEAVESDLGEYIVQLARETPSHIIIPAIHKTRQQISDLFSEVAGETIPSDTPTLTAFARRILREKFITSEIGLSGCNSAVAESGSIVLFTNEGNGRMVTTLPPVHVVLMGMERIVPTFADLEVIMNLLPRSATGQKITSYMSIISGPRREEELDGPEELHLIIVDNGRSGLLGDPDFQPALNCIRCGSCFNVCPVYRQIGGHAYGWVYAGPIGAVLTPLLTKDLKGWGEVIYASSLCAACAEACPVMIPVNDMLVKLRRRRTQDGFTPSLEKLGFNTWRRFFRNSGSYRFAFKSGYYAQKPFMKGNHLEGGPSPLSGWTNSRYFPAVSKQTFRERWNELSKE